MTTCCRSGGFRYDLPLAAHGCAAARWIFVAGCAAVFAVAAAAVAELPVLVPCPSSLVSSTLVDDRRHYRGTCPRTCQHPQIQVPKSPQRQF